MKFKKIILLSTLSLLAGCLSMTRYGPLVRQYDNDSAPFLRCWYRNETPTTPPKDESRLEAAFAVLNRASDRSGCLNNEVQPELWACARTLPEKKPASIEDHMEEDCKMLKCMNEKGYKMRSVSGNSHFRTFSINEYEEQCSPTKK